jgi:hypothetical protein
MVQCVITSRNIDLGNNTFEFGDRITMPHRTGGAGLSGRAKRPDRQTSYWRGWFAEARWDGHVILRLSCASPESPQTYLRERVALAMHL